MQTAIVIAIIVLALLFLARRFFKATASPSSSCGCSDCPGCSGSSVYSGADSRTIPPMDVQPKDAPDACSSCSGSSGSAS